MHLTVTALHDGSFPSKDGEMEVRDSCFASEVFDEGSGTVPFGNCSGFFPLRPLLAFENEI